MNTYEHKIGANTFELRRISYSQRLELRKLMKSELAEIRRLQRERTALIGEDAEALGTLQDTVAEAIAETRKAARDGDTDALLAAERKYRSASLEIVRLLGEERHEALCVNLEADADAAEACGPIYLRWAVAGAEYNCEKHGNWASLEPWLSEADAYALIEEIKREAGLSVAEQGNSESPSTSPVQADGEIRATTAGSASA